MKLALEKTKNYFLRNTEVSNIFIKMYMPQLPDQSIKVYLYALMYTDASINVVTTNEGIAEELSMDVEDVLAAWTALEKNGVIRKHFPDKTVTTVFNVEFLDLRGRLVDGVEDGRTSSGNEANTSGASDAYGLNDASDRSSSLDEDDIRDMYRRIETVVGRPLSDSELRLVGSFTNVYGLEPAAVAFTFEYCKNRGTSVKPNYIERILMSYADAGMKTVADIEAHNAQHDMREMQYKKIMIALGLQYETVTSAERNEFSKWMDDYGFTVEEILQRAELAAGKKNKFSYVKKIIETNAKEKGVLDITSAEKAKAAANGKRTGKSRKAYYEEHKRQSEDNAHARRVEVYAKIPEIEKIDGRIKTMHMDMIVGITKKSSNSEHMAKALTEQIAELRQTRKDLLAGAGYEEDYTEIKYFCPSCKDTGILDSGASCPCYQP
ncbi:MAG: DnaD domain protein [Clostridiales Family XIII bacterium]|jgi:DNA replication protein DnaD|nr:DnaD domain protein [Clostridiales Family XIII bacterium]